jgi:hypothetical protein
MLRHLMGADSEGRKDGAGDQGWAGGVEAVRLTNSADQNPGFSETLLAQSAADIMRRTLDSRD